MAIKNYSCPAYGKKLESTFGFTKHMNIYISHQVFSIYMQPKQDIPIPRKDKNTAENILLHVNKKSTLEKQDIKRDHRNSGGKSLNIRSYTRVSLS